MRNKIVLAGCDPATSLLASVVESIPTSTMNGRVAASTPPKARPAITC